MSSSALRFLLLYLEVGRKLISAYGGIGGALGWPLAFGRGSAEDAPPPTVVAAMATTVFNTIGTVVGAAVLASSLVNLYFPEFKVDALLAKNMTYFFGHVFINASIYMAVIAVYEIIPEYTGIPWKTSRMFVLAWSAVLLFVMAVYPHHLLQDVAMPAWALVMGQVVSYLFGHSLAGGDGLFADRLSAQGRQAALGSRVRTARAGGCGLVGWIGPGNH